MVSTFLLKHFSHADLFLASSFPTTPSLFPFRPSTLSLPSKPISPISLSFSIKNKQTQQTLLVPHIAQTSDWAQQEDAEEEDGLTPGLSDWEAEVEVEGESEVEVESGVVSEGGDGFVEESYEEPPEDAKLFVGNLPYDVDSERLAQLFDKAGIVEVAEVIYNRETDQSRGFGFVTMSTVQEAEKAVEMFHRYDIGGRLLTVNKAAPRGSRPERPPQEFEPSLRIYAGNLPWQVDDARLENFFSQHGKVISARVVYDRESGRSRGFGFVTMASQSELDDAIAALDGQSLDGRTLRVNVAEEKPQRRGSF